MRSRSRKKKAGVNEHANDGVQMNERFFEALVTLMGDEKLIEFVKFLKQFEEEGHPRKPGHSKAADSG